MAQSAKDLFIASKMKRIKTEGVRKNTHAPVSASNPRRAVDRKQAIAIALSEGRKKGY